MDLIYGALRFANSNGLVWSRTPDSMLDYAYNFEFGFGGHIILAGTNNPRWAGFAVWVALFLSSLDI